MAIAARMRPTSSCRARLYRKIRLYVNLEGRVQLANRAIFPPGDAREDWSIFRALSDVLGAKLPYDSLQQLRTAMFDLHPHLENIGEAKQPIQLASRRFGQGCTQARCRSIRCAGRRLFPDEPDLPGQPGDG
jgi:NADH dehydrogenase/NADH:ubiquinone oxidoreductase subunit G